MQLTERQRMSRTERRINPSECEFDGYLDGKLYLEHQLSEPVSARVGLWSKADSRMYFSDFTVTPAD